MTEQPSPVQRLFAQNAQWAKHVNETDPNFFHDSTTNPQQPHTLWIGCSDSRVPESVITNSRPGDIFVHRNIANQLHLNDINALSVLAFAVNVLGVQHVAIVGHTECGGAASCLEAVQLGDSGPSEGLLRSWLTPLTELVDSLDVSTLPDAEAIPIIVEANVKGQVRNLCQTETIRDAWKEGKDVSVHGWVYDLATGRLRDLEISQSGI